MNRNSTRHGTGIALLYDPRWNKGTAFSEDEREREKLVGLLPEGVEDIERQRTRVLQQLGHQATDIERYVYLDSLLDRNETLFYRVLMGDPARFLPIVYDPTVGEACLKFGHIYRRPRGLYVSMKRKGRVREVLKQLALSRRPLHVREHRRAHPRPRRSRGERHGHPHRQASALYRLRRGATRAAPPHPPRLRNQQSPAPR